MLPVVASVFAVIHVHVVLQSATLAHVEGRAVTVMLIIAHPPFSTGAVIETNAVFKLFAGSRTAEVIVGAAAQRFVTRLLLEALVPMQLMAATDTLYFILPSRPTTVTGEPPAELVGHVHSALLPQSDSVQAGYGTAVAL